MGGVFFDERSGHIVDYAIGFSLSFSVAGRSNFANDSLQAVSC